MDSTIWAQRVVDKYNPKKPQKASKVKQYLIFLWRSLDCAYISGKISKKFYLKHKAEVEKALRIIQNRERLKIKRAKKEKK